MRTAETAQEFRDTRAYRDPDRLRRDHRRFHELAVASGDVDPVYPVYRDLAHRLALTRAERAWLIFCHVAYYHMGSALAAFAATRRNALEAGLAPLNLPVATERRAHWSRGRLARHLTGLARAAQPYGGDLASWATDDLPDDPHAAWSVLTERLATLDGNGRWAAFKTAEMLAAIAGVPVRAPDMGHASSSGPRHGLKLLHPDAPDGNAPPDIAQLDHLSERLVAELRGRGLAATLETVETTLCDFHALHDGGYYVGHDIDLMQDQINQVPGPLTTEIFAARVAALPAEYLGEQSGWSGVDRARKRHYRRTGQVLARGEG